jgi:hypothetical protein
LDALGRPLGGGLVVSLSKKGGKVANAVRGGAASLPAAHAVDLLLEQESHLGS